jgi:hypothetical protein
LNGYNLHITFSFCQHHRCSVGNCTTTATAGGILFRCYDCITDFCEDCLEPYYDLENFDVKTIMQAAPETATAVLAAVWLWRVYMGRFISLEILGLKVQIVAPSEVAKGKKRSIKSAMKDENSNVRVDKLNYFLSRKSIYFKTLHLRSCLTCY